MTWNDELDVMAADLDETFAQASVTLTERARTGFNTTTGVPTGIETSVVRRAIVGPIRSEPSSAGSGRHSINARDFVFVVSDLTPVVEQGMTITYDGVEWTVTSVDVEAVSKMRRAKCREAI